jgi:hypothetical protein
MTGYPSKRAAAQDKLVDDRRAYYEKFDDLYAVYLNGVYDGKKAAQPAQELVAIEYWLQNTVESGCWVKTSLITKADAEKMLSGAFGDMFPQGRIIEPSPFTPQTAQEPVPWVGVDFDINTTPPQPASVTYKEVADTMNRLWRGTPEQKQIAIETENMRLYTAPPQRPWVGLTAEEAAECWTTTATQTWKNFEAKLKGKNT